MTLNVVAEHQTTTTHLRRHGRRPKSRSGDSTTLTTNTRAATFRITRS